MNVVLAVACDQARVRPDGKMDIVGAFDALYAPGFPAVQERMTAVFVLEWDEDESGRHEFSADLVDADGTRVLTIEGHTDVEERPVDRAPARTRIVMPMERVVFPHAGRYRFVLEVDGHECPAFSLFVGEQPDGADPTEGERV